MPVLVVVRIRLQFCKGVVVSVGLDAVHRVDRVMFSIRCSLLQLCLLVLRVFLFMFGGCCCTAGGPTLVFVSCLLVV